MAWKNFWSPKMIPQDLSSLSFSVSDVNQDYNKYNEILGSSKSAEINKLIPGMLMVISNRDGNTCSRSTNREGLKFSINNPFAIGDSSYDAPNAKIFYSSNAVANEYIFMQFKKPKIASNCILITFAASSYTNNSFILITPTYIRSRGVNYALPATNDDSYITIIGNVTTNGVMPTEFKIYYNGSTNIFATHNVISACTEIRHNSSYSSAAGSGLYPVVPESVIGSLSSVNEPYIGQIYKIINLPTVATDASGATPSDGITPIDDILNSSSRSMNSSLTSPYLIFEDGGSYSVTVDTTDLDSDKTLVAIGHIFRWMSQSYTTDATMSVHPSPHLGHSSFTQRRNTSTLNSAAPPSNPSDHISSNLWQGNFSPADLEDFEVTMTFNGVNT